MQFGEGIAGTVAQTGQSMQLLDGPGAMQDCLPACRQAITERTVL